MSDNEVLTAKRWRFVEPSGSFEVATDQEVLACARAACLPACTDPPHTDPPYTFCFNFDASSE